MEKSLIGLIVALGVSVILNVAFVVLYVTKSPKETCKSSARDFIGAGRIVGGKTVSIGQYPFMAAIIIKKHGRILRDSLQCGCSIVSAKWVLTAAHCIRLIEGQDFSRDVVLISAGSESWKKGSRHEVVDWASHEKYDNEVMNDDIALIRVKQQFKGSLEKPIHLPSNSYQYEDDKKVEVIGWGLTKSTAKVVQDTLRGVNVNIIDKIRCLKMYGDQALTDSMFCAGAIEGGRDACQFDSGGPIFDKDVLIGIVSWGVDCAVKNQPGIYTRVDLYKDWIVQTTKNLNAPLVIKERSEKKNDIKSQS